MASFTLIVTKRCLNECSIRIDDCAWFWDDCYTFVSRQYELQATSYFQCYTEDNARDFIEEMTLFSGEVRQHLIQELLSKIGKLKTEFRSVVLLQILPKMADINLKLKTIEEFSRHIIHTQTDFEQATQYISQLQEIIRYIEGNRLELEAARMSQIKRFLYNLLSKLKSMFTHH